MTRHDNHNPRGRRKRRRIGAMTVAAIALTLAATACNDSSSNEPDPLPPETSTPTSSETPTSTPTKDPDAWRANYKPAQLKAYDAALQSWEEYETRSEPIWAKGKATPAAEQLFKEYFPHPIWIDYWERLKTYETAEVKTEGTPEVYWSKAKSITKSGSGVRIQQCVDYAAVVGTQNGKPVVRYPWMEKPQLRTIYLTQPDGYDWLIFGVVDISEGKSRPCKP